MISLNLFLNLYRNICAKKSKSRLNIKKILKERYAEDSGENSEDPIFKSIKNNAKITKIVNRIEGITTQMRLAKAAVKYAG